MLGLAVPGGKAAVHAQKLAGNVGPVSYTHLDVYKRQRIYGGTAQLIKRHKKTELHIQHDIYPVSYTHLVRAF